jgi:hypothetical protein
MDRIKMSFIDNDYTVRASTDVNEAREKGLGAFLEQIQEELATGESAFLEIRGVDGAPMRFNITSANM